MPWEKTWVTNPNVTIYTGSNRVVNGQSVLYELKNRLVASGGWTVVGSSDGTTNYEYEGVTGGGSYGGGSTGPYDVWSSTSSIPRAEDGSGPGWCLLKGPLVDGWQPFLVIAFEGTYDDGYFAVSDLKWELSPTNPLTYLPVEAAGAKSIIHTRKTFFTLYSGTYTTRGYFSFCPADGSFVLPLNLTIRTFFTNLIAFTRLDPLTVPAGFPPWTLGGMGQFNGFSEAASYWRLPPGPYMPEEYQGIATWGTPRRYNNVVIMDSDLATVDCNGEAALFPFYVCNVYEDTNFEYVQAVYGRIQDMWIAPEDLVDGDYFPSASVEYFKCGFWVVPGDTAPVVGP